jgi:hypothetical protein
VKRYNEWKENGGGGFKKKSICIFILYLLSTKDDPSSFSGDLKPELKKKAGLNTPKSNREAPSGSNIAPGSNNKETDNEANLAELQDHSALESEQGGETEKGNKTEKQSEGDKDVTAFIRNKFENTFLITPTRDASGVMQGFFVQDKIRDPDNCPLQLPIPSHTKTIHLQPMMKNL